MGTVHSASATEPYATLSTTSPSGTYRIERRPTFDDAIAIMDSSNHLLHSLSITNMFSNDTWIGTDDLEISTAGLNWHLNSIAYITTNDATFIMRHRTGNYIVIDLSKGQPRPITQDEKMDADIRVRDAALSLLYSTDSSDRKTGCIHCGQLGVVQSIPRLRELLEDKAFYGVSGGNHPEPIVFLYVRKAAVDALAALGHNIDHIRYEFPDKQVMRYDEDLNQYVIDLPTEDGIEQSVPAYGAQSAPSAEP